MGWIAGILAYIGLLILERIAGLLVASWVASLIFAYGVGVFYGAGSEILKREKEGEA